MTFNLFCPTIRSSVRSHTTQLSASFDSQSSLLQTITYLSVALCSSGRLMVDLVITRADRLYLCAIYAIEEWQRKWDGVAEG